MRGNIFFTAFCALLGFGLLVSLAVWQWNKVGPKTAMIESIEARLTEDAVALPEIPTEEADEYQRVTIDGTFLPGQIRALAATPQGSGYRIIAPFETSGRTIMVDRGFVPRAQADLTWPTGTAEVVGNLHWPNEGGSGIPDPDMDNLIWFARDVPSMAATLGTDPILVVQSNQTDGAPFVMPVTPNLPNDHFGYAIQWFCMAIAWAMMTSWYIWRMWRGRNEKA
ncbi:SURF1 family protein [Paracoccaceae bacterium GXU_MW_L88]